MELEKTTTSEQRQEIAILEELMKTTWRKMILEFINESIKVRSGILLWDLVPTENIDEVKYSRSMVLREELKILKSIADYPTNILKTKGIYQEKKTL